MFLFVVDPLSTRRRLYFELRRVGLPGRLDLELRVGSVVGRVRNR
jgi:hypothetical protein